MKTAKSFRLSPAAIGNLSYLKKELGEIHGTKWTETDVVEYALAELLRQTVDRSKEFRTERGW